MITLNENFEVLVDGVVKGALADTIKNRPELVSDIQRAVVPALTSLKAASDTVLKAAQDKANADAATAKTAADAALKAKSDELATAMSDFALYRSNAENLIAAAVANVDDHDALKAVVAEAMQPAIERKRSELDSQISALQQQKAALA